MKLTVTVKPSIWLLSEMTVMTTPSNFLWIIWVKWERTTKVCERLRVRVRHSHREERIRVSCCSTNHDSACCLYYECRIIHWWESITERTQEIRERWKMDTSIAADVCCSCSSSFTMKVQGESSDILTLTYLHREEWKKQKGSPWEWEKRST